MPAMKAAKLLGNFGERGPNVHLPVCAATESVLFRHNRGISQVVSGAEVYSAPSALPQANTSTIRHRWKKRVAFGIGGSGWAVDPDRVLNDAVEAESGLSLNYTVSKDNLGLNNCIMGFDERILQELLDAGIYDEDNCPTFFSSWL